MKPQKHYLCPSCDCPMLPKGEKKQKDFYDHATGCPLSYASVFLERRVTELEKALRQIETLALSCMDTHKTTCGNMVLIQELAEDVLLAKRAMEGK
jgi:hypothetical protein